MPGLFKFPLASTWLLDTGLEAIGNVIRFIVGGGAAWGHELDGNSVPSVNGWSDNVSGGATITAANGEIIFSSPSTGQTAFSILADATWPGLGRYFNTPGLTVYIRRVGLNPTTNAALELGDSFRSVTMTQFANGWNVNSPAASDASKDDEFFYSIFADKVIKWSRFSGGDGLWILRINDQALTISGNSRILIGDTSGAAVFVQRAGMDLFRARTGPGTPFATIPLVAEMPAAIIPTGPITQIDLLELTGLNSNLFYQYDLGSGYNAIWVTLATLQSVLIGNTYPSLRIKTQFNSDGVTQATLNLDGTQSVLGSESGNAAAAGMFAGGVISA